MSIEHLFQFSENTFIEKWRMRFADWRGRGIYSGYPDKHLCIFCHIPKTGGTSVANALFGEESRHIPYSVFQEANPSKFDSYFKFAFVRNPWARLVSAYFFLKGGGMNVADRQWAQDHLAGVHDFKSFVREKLHEEAVRSFVHFLPQSHFVARGDGKVMMDFVGRFENLSNDFQAVTRKLNIEADLTPVNEGAHRDYREYYDDETKGIAGRLYARDAALFGYAFEA